MRIDVASPEEAPPGRVCIVVDVLRASSTIVTMFERGADRIVCAASIDEARRLHERLPDHLLCGEWGGLPPEGFDYGNSPVEFSRIDLTGKSIIHATGNGTKALAEVAGDARAVLVGCMLNCRAVAAAAVRMANERGAGIAIVAAGDPDGSSEDTICAKVIADAIEGRAPGEDAGRQIQETTHAETLHRLGLGADVDYCARLDISSVVPMLQPDDAGLLVLKASPPSPGA